jgi:hypothetical protein
LVKHGGELEVRAKPGRSLHPADGHEKIRQQNLGSFQPLAGYVFHLRHPRRGLEDLAKVSGAETTAAATGGTLTGSATCAWMNALARVTPGGSSG